MSDSVQNKKLIEAIEAQDLDAVKAALENGASPDVRETETDWKHTPLILALQKEQHDIALCLLDAGTDIHAIDGLQVNPVHHAAAAGFTDIVERLLDEGIEVDIRNVWGKTPLMHAAEKNRVDTMRLLVDRGADINTQDRDDCSILSTAAAYESTQAALFLLEHGADPNVKQMHPPLHSAADHGDVLLMKALIEAGADIQTQKFTGETPLHIALRKGDIFKPEDYADKMKPYIEIATLLLEHPDTDIECRDNSKHTPLLCAASHGNLAMIKTLEDMGADPHVRGDNDETMLMLASWFRHHDTVEHLIKTGHDVNEAPDVWGNTVFLKAAEWARVDIMELLKENGADMTVSNQKNENALMIGVKRGKEDGIRYLLDQNVFDLTQRDHEGKSAQDIARSFSNPEFAEMIDAHIEKLKREALEKQRREEEAHRKQVAAELEQEGDVTKTRVLRIRKKHGQRRLPRP